MDHVSVFFVPSLNEFVLACRYVLRMSEVCASTCLCMYGWVERHKVNNFQASPHRFWWSTHSHLQVCVNYGQNYFGRHEMLKRFWHFCTFSIPIFFRLEFTSLTPKEVFWNIVSLLWSCPHTAWSVPIRQQYPKIGRFWLEATSSSWYVALHTHLTNVNYIFLFKNYISCLFVLVMMRAWTELVWTIPGLCDQGCRATVVRLGSGLNGAAAGGSDHGSGSTPWVWPLE